MKSSRLLLLTLFLLFLSACAQPPDTEDPTDTPFFVVTSTAAPTATQQAAEPAQPDATSQPTAKAPDPATTPRVFVPLAGSGDASPTTTPLPPATLPPATPQPSSTPEPPYPPYDGPPLDRERVGLQIYLHRQDMRDLVRHFQALDVGWVKVQVSWKLYEPQPGQYDAERFGELDRLVEAANNNGVKLLLSVSKAPEWSRPITEEDGPPSDFGRYEDFMRYLATRYPGRVQAYELWNEPNLRREWNGAPLDPAQLVELTRRGAAGVRSVDTQALIVSAGPATTGINDGVSAVDDRVYLQGMLAAGIGEVVDGIGVHPYGWANPAPASVVDAQQVAPSHNEHPSFFFRDTMEDYHALLRASGVDRPLWATEFGWGTFENMRDEEGNPVGPPPGAEFMNNVSEWDQAVYTMQAYELAQQWAWAGPLFLWNLNFAPGVGPAFSESGYSILRADASRRPAYRTLENR